MKYDMMILEAYLDGELPAAEAAGVRASAAADATVRDLLRRLESQRALRAAAMSSYAPDEAAAAALTAAILDQASAPIGRVGFMKWTRRLGTVAAMLVISGGAFIYGRSSAPTQTVAVEHTVVQDHYVVQIVTSTGEATEHVFASKEEANDFVAEVKKQQDGTVVAGVF